MDKTYRSYAALVGAALLMAAPAIANSVFVVSADTPTCDVLAIPASPVALEELGDPAGGFLVGEQIAVSAGTTNFSPCDSVPDNPLVATNALVHITNLNAIAFSAVWYVADYDTTLTNEDGKVLGVASAFRIDADGANVPLVGGDINGNTFFDPGETWDFVIRDYFNAFGLPASAINSVNLPSAGLGSSGSIVALPVPEPSTAVLLGLGLLGIALARRRAA